MSDANAPDYVADAQSDDGRPPAEIVAEYARGAASLREAVAGMGGDDLRARPVPGRWSTLELLCHLADCEQMYAERLKRTLGMDRPLLMGIDPVAYAEPLRHNGRDPALVLDLFAVTRAECAAALEGLGDDQWRRQAVHSETGLVTVRQLVLHPCRHLDHHLPFIAEKRRDLGN